MEIIGRITLLLGWNVLFGISAAIYVGTLNLFSVLAL